MANQLARPLTRSRRVAVVGAGWAGIAAAVHARRAGHTVHLFEMAAQAGGRARSVFVDRHELDNGQHILIGAYTATLELMRIVDVDVSTLMRRLPLALQYPDGSGLRLRPGSPVAAFVRAVLGRRGWSWAERASLLIHATRWAASRFHCDEATSVAELCASLPPVVREQLIEPLCLAALNTPAAMASAQVFLRVLRDALFGGPGAADLLLPAAPLGSLLPQPALAWLQAQGAHVHFGSRVIELRPDSDRWRVDAQVFDAVVLACTANEAARLSARFAPGWSDVAAQLRYEPIVTVYLHCPGARLARPMTVLHANHRQPAQFVFDLGALGGARGVFALVISGARAWVERGLPATGAAALAQAVDAFAPCAWPQPPTLLHVLAEKRATFLCLPGLQRPPALIAPGLWAAGDYVAGPYPATLEGAVRSGRAAAQCLSA